MASTDLLIGQWRNSENLKAAIQIYLDVIRTEIHEPRQRMRAMRLIDSAEGVWLDYLGVRLGIRRPYTSEIGDDPRWGFDAAGVGFDLAPFRGAAINDAVFALPDVAYKRFVKARAITVLSDGSFGAFEAAAAEIDANASVSDRLNMTLWVVTDNRWQFELADQIRALPRTAGVRIIYRDRERWGFDEAGRPFDAGVFASAGAGAPMPVPDPGPTPDTGAYAAAYSEAYR